jgi:hypothetical protein
MSAQPYRFAIESFRIDNTRARHEDTVFVSASLAVGRAQPQTHTRRMGDLNNGTYSPDVPFEAVSIDDNDTVVLSYTIINNGHTDPNVVEKALGQAASTLAGKAAQAAASAVGGAIGSVLGAEIGTAAVPLVGTALGALAGWIVGEVGGALFANCDGAVAAGVHPFTGAQLRAVASDGKILQNTDHNPGTDSPTGCGSNSDYYVTWSIRTYEVHGLIRDKWIALGAANGLAGHPVTNETGCPDGRGRYNHFEKNCSIYWTPQTGAHEVHGFIRGKWAELGWERGLGYPLSDEEDMPGGGRMSRFERGVIRWQPNKEAWVTNQ